VTHDQIYTPCHYIENPHSQMTPYNRGGDSQMTPRNRWGD
jgi:hypothetical protein